MLNVFLFIVLPYVALALFLFVTPYRYFSNRLTWSAYSTQFLEQKALYWGSNPWHYGIIPVLFAHLSGRGRARTHERPPGEPADPDPPGEHRARTRAVRPLRMPGAHGAPRANPHAETGDLRRRTGFFSAF